MSEQLFDAVVCVLLIATIAHLALVQRRLRAFRAERDRLQAFVTALDFTVERAETAIRRLRSLETNPPNPEEQTPRSVRQRDPEELLRAARRVAQVDGKPAKSSVSAAKQPASPSASQQTSGA